MAASTRMFCPSCLSALPLRTSLLRSAPKTTSPFAQQAIRTATSQNALKYRRKDVPASQKRKKARTTYLQPDLKKAIQFSLVDAMRYLRASEVGRSPASSKYELHIRLRTPKNGAVVRNRLRLPHPVKTDLKICVICPDNSSLAQNALAAGASLAGDESVFAQIKEGTVDFDRCIAHIDSLQALQKAQLGRILGPRGLMPSAKTNTVVKDVVSAVRDMAGASEYRERLGVVRMAVGQLGFGVEEVSKNIKAFIDSVKRDMQGISEQTAKEIHEVVLSSTNGPGLSLNGTLRSEGSVDARAVSSL